VTTLAVPKLNGIVAAGTACPHFDRIRIVSDKSVGALKTRLPMVALESASHSFNVIRYKGPEPRLQSRLDLVETRRSLSLPILIAHLHDLGSYRITQAEIACDLPAI
jgi:hypothetical protein